MNKSLRAGFRFKSQRQDAALRGNPADTGDVGRFESTFLFGRSAEWQAQFCEWSERRRYRTERPPEERRIVALHGRWLRE